MKKQCFHAMQRPKVHPQTWFLSCDLAGGHRLAEVRLKRIRIRVLCCSVGVHCVTPILRLLHTGAGKDHECCRGSPQQTTETYGSDSCVGTLSWFSFPWAQSGDDVEFYQCSGSSLGSPGCDGQSWSLCPWAARIEEDTPFGMLLRLRGHTFFLHGVIISHGGPAGPLRMGPCVQAPSRLQDQV